MTLPSPHTPEARLTFHYDIVALTLTPSGFVRGPFWLVFDDRTGFRRHLPEEGCTDLVAADLCQWLKKVETMRVGGEAAHCWFTSSYGFMFDITPRDSGMYHVRCYEQATRHQVPHGEWAVLRSDVDQGLRHAARAVLSECERRGWTGPHVDGLRTALKATGDAASG